MTIASALVGLLEVVESDRQERCAAILAEAEAQASKHLATLRGEARSRLQAALRQERASYRTQISAARAALQAARRRQWQGQAALAVAAAAARLPAALQALWEQPQRRREWLQAALRRAAATLPRRDWRCRHPAALPAGDLAWLRTGVEALGVVDACFLADGGMAAGIEIRVGGELGEAVLDATSVGLLADRVAVEGRLRHWLEAT